MKRPLLPSERVTVDIATELEGNPKITDLFAQVMFVFGMVIGRFPTAQVEVMMDTNTTGTAVQMEIDLTIALEELGA